MSIDEQLKKIKAFRKKIKTKKQARAFLQKTGIYTPTGRLKKEWR